MNQDITVKYFRYDKSNVAVFEKKSSSLVEKLV